MFTKTAELYDLVYGFKAYNDEASKLHELIRKYKVSSGNTLLDIGCGTGHHIQYLKRLYEVQGLDLDNGLLEVARQRNPELTFHCADMTDFALDATFDVITCLFSSIGYVQTVAGLESAISRMAVHLKPGGVLFVVPWFTPETYTSGVVHALTVERPDLKLCRMNVSKVEGGVSILDFHYLLGTPAGVEHFTEEHRLGLFSQEEHIQAFRKSGLDVSYDHGGDQDGLLARGMYIGIRPLK